MTLRQLQILVHVHRAGNLTRAATQLGLTQAAVSLQLQQLEKTFGLRLFDRTTRELTATIAGLQAIAGAEQSSPPPPASATRCAISTA